VTRRQAAYLLGLLGLVNLAHYAVRNVPSPLYDALRLRFGADHDQIGLVGTSFILPHALATVLAGWLADRVERRRLLAGSIAIWSAATALAAVAQSMDGFLVARALAGLGTASCVPVANALICDAFPPARAARAVSVFNLGMFFGGVVGVMAGERLGYPTALWVLVAPGVVLAALVLAAPAPVAPAAASSLSMRSPRAALAGVVRDVRQLLAIVPYRWTVSGCVVMAFAAGAYVAWFVELLHLKGMRGAEVNTLFVFAGTGGLCGVLAGAVVADRWRRGRPHGRQQIIALSTAVAVPFSIMAIELPAGTPFYLACAGMMFFISWYHAPVVASVDELAPQGHEATAQGLYIFCMHLLGTAPSSYLVALLMPHVGLENALYLPTGAMLVASLLFVGAASSVRQAARVLKPPS
jgi:predicted MFS family arabinose efflux permease